MNARLRPLGFGEALNFASKIGGGGFMPKVAIPFGVVIGILAFLSLGAIVGEKSADKFLGLAIAVAISLAGFAVAGTILFFIVIFIGAIFLPPLKKRGKRKK